MPTVLTNGFLSRDNDHVGVGNNHVDADSFVHNVELQFGASRYKEFISVMKAYKESRIDNREVVIRVCELLVGYPSLIEKFNSFLPNGYYLVPSDMLDDGESYITLKTPEGDTVCPGECTRKHLVPGVSASLR